MFTLSHHQEKGEQLIFSAKIWDATYSEEPIKTINIHSRDNENMPAAKVSFFVEQTTEEFFAYCKQHDIPITDTRGKI